MIASTPGVVWWGRLQVTGLELLPLEGPLLLVGDHDSYWDTVAAGIAAAPRRQIRALAKSSMWTNKLLGAVLNGMGQIPIERGSGDSGGAAASAIWRGRCRRRRSSGVRAPARSRSRVFPEHARTCGSSSSSSIDPRSGPRSHRSSTAPDCSLRSVSVHQSRSRAASAPQRSPAASSLGPQSWRSPESPAARAHSRRRSPRPPPSTASSCQPQTTSAKSRSPASRVARDSQPAAAVLTIASDIGAYSGPPSLRRPKTTSPPGSVSRRLGRQQAPPASRRRRQSRPKSCLPGRKLRAAWLAGRDAPVAHPDDDYCLANPRARDIGAYTATATVWIPEPSSALEAADRVSRTNVHGQTGSAITVARVPATVPPPGDLRDQTRRTALTCFGLVPRSGLIRWMRWMCPGAIGMGLMPVFPARMLVVLDRR